MNTPPLIVQADPQLEPPAPKSYDVQYLAHEFRAYTSPWIGGWDVAAVRHARDAHALGQFSFSARLADALTTDPRVLAALLQRIGPPMGLPMRITDAGRAWEGKPLAETIRDYTEGLFEQTSPACPAGTRATIFRTMAMLGVFIGQNVARPRRDGSRVDFELRPWPMREASWNSYLRRYQLRSTEGLITVEPNDGKWVVIEPHGFESFLFGAVRALALVWADRQYGIRDRSNHSESHGSGKLIGTLPPNVPINSPEGQDFIAMTKNLYAQRAGGVKPNGSVVEFLEAKTLAYKIFEEIVDSASTDIAIALLGQDGTTEKGTVYSPPALEGVRFDLVEMDLAAASAGLTNQFAKPLTVINWGRDDVVSNVGWLIPDLREEARSNQLAAKHEAYNRAIAAYKGNGFDLTQDVVNRLAKEYGVAPMTLAPKPKTLPVGPGGTPPEGGVDQLPPAPNETQTQKNEKTDGGLAAA